MVTAVALVAAVAGVKPLAGELSRPTPPQPKNKNKEVTNENLEKMSPSLDLPPSHPWAVWMLREQVNQTPWWGKEGVGPGCVHWSWEGQGQQEGGV